MTLPWPSNPPARPLSTLFEARHFEALYDDVTKGLAGFVSEATSKAQISAAEDRWLQDVTNGFTDQFFKWGDKPPANASIAAYLQMVARAPKIVRLAGHAFLHIGYDLPRVLADHMNDCGLDRARKRGLFLKPTPMFRQIFMDTLKKGTFGIVGRALGFMEPIEVLAYWVVSLRSIAWIHAEILTDQPGARPLLERQMAMALHEVGKDVGQFFWRVPRLDNSRLLQVAPLAILPVAGSDRLWPYVLAVVAALLALLIGACRARNAIVATKIATMGQHFSVEAGRALAGVDEKFEPRPARSRDDKLGSASRPRE